MNQSVTPKSSNSTILTIVKWFLTIMFILTSLACFGQGKVAIGLLFFILSLLLFPPFSEYLKSNLKIWQNKVFRYLGYVGIFFVASVFITADGINSLQEKSVSLKSEKSKNESKNKIQVRMESFI